MVVPKRPRRVHVVLPASLLQAIDEQVGKGRRSEFIREAADEKLTFLRRVDACERSKGSSSDGEIPEQGTRESAVEE